jgi:predicted nucleotide-binding protein
MASAKRTILVLSTAYFPSRVADEEWRFAFQLDPTGERGLLIPVRVGPVNLPAALRNRVYIDLVGKDAATARELLIQGVSDRGAQPAREPHFPGSMEELVMDEGEAVPAPPLADEEPAPRSRRTALHSKIVPPSPKVTRSSGEVEMTSKPVPITKPRLFIGSSREGLPIAENLQLNLDYAAYCTIWSQGVFGLSRGTLEALVEAAKDFDYAALVLTPDDLQLKRNVAGNSPRDNVLFELGVFMGILGRDRTFIVYCRDKPLDLPTDLAGVTAATFADRPDGNLHAALGPVATLIKREMRVSP